MELMELIDRELVDRVKLSVALLTFSLLLADLLLSRAGRPQLLRRLHDALLAAAGPMAALCWWELGRFQFESDRPSLRWVNVTDSFHYHMGPKHFRELGSQLSNYYYVLLLPFAMLWPRNRSVGIALIDDVLTSHWQRGRRADSVEFSTRSSAVAGLFVAYAMAVVCFARGPLAEAVALQAPA